MPKKRVKRTNEYVVRNEMSAEELAVRFIREINENVYDYDQDSGEEYYSIDTYYVTSDGGSFEDYNDALAHEIEWLGSPADG